MYAVSIDTVVAARCDSPMCSVLTLCTSCFILHLLVSGTHGAGTHGGWYLLGERRADDAAVARS